MVHGTNPPCFGAKPRKGRHSFRLHHHLVRSTHVHVPFASLPLSLARFPSSSPHFPIPSFSLHFSHASPVETFRCNFPLPSLPSINLHASNFTKEEGSGLPSPFSCFLSFVENQGTTLPWRSSVTSWMHDRERFVRPNGPRGTVSIVQRGLALQRSFPSAEGGTIPLVLVPSTSSFSCSSRLVSLVPRRVSLGWFLPMSPSLFFPSTSSVSTSVSTRAWLPNILSSLGNPSSIPSNPNHLPFESGVPFPFPPFDAPGVCLHPRCICTGGASPRPPLPSGCIWCTLGCVWWRVPLRATMVRFATFGALFATAYFALSRVQTVLEATDAK